MAKINLDVAQESTVQEILDKVQNNGIVIDGKNVSENIIKSYSTRFEVVGELPYVGSGVSICSNDKYIYMVYNKIGTTTANKYDVSLVVYNKSDFSFKTSKVIASGTYEYDGVSGICANNDYVIVSYPTSAYDGKWRQYNAETLELTGESAAFAGDYSTVTAVYRHPYNSNIACGTSYFNGNSISYCININTLAITTITNFDISSIYFTRDYAYAYRYASSSYYYLYKINASSFPTASVTCQTRLAYSNGISCVDDKFVYGVSSGDTEGNIIDKNFTSSSVFTGYTDGMLQLFNSDKYGYLCIYDGCITRLVNQTPVVCGKVTHTLSRTDDDEYFYSIDSENGRTLVLKFVSYGFSNEGFKGVSAE